MEEEYGEGGFQCTFKAVGKRIYAAVMKTKLVTANVTLTWSINKKSGKMSIHDEFSAEPVVLTLQPKHRTTDTNVETNESLMVL